MRLGAMNLSLINQNIEAQAKAGEEAKRVQTVLSAFDKVCNDNGFEDYADFLEKVAVYEGKAKPAQKPVKESKKTPAKAKKGTGKKGGKGNKIADVLRAAIVKDLKAGEMTTHEIAKAHGVSAPTVSNIKDAEGLTKKRKPKDASADKNTAASNVATLVSSDPANPTG